MDISYDANVYCTDGLYGRSTRVVLNPKDRRVTYLVVKEKQQPHAERMLPIKQVTRTTADEIHLNCNKDTASKAQSFEVNRYVPVPKPGSDAYQALSIGHYSENSYLGTREYIPIKYTAIPLRELTVYRNARVKATNGTVGRLREFLVNPTDGQITHLVLREGYIWGQEAFTIPISIVDRFEEETVYLKLNKRAIAAFQTVPIHHFARRKKVHADH